MMMIEEISLKGRLGEYVHVRRLVVDGRVVMLC